MNRILSAKTMALALLLVVALVAAACAGSDGTRGSKGDLGDTGAAGPAGGQGLQGEQGEQGARGVYGMEGLPGLPGVPGPQGAPGPSLNASLAIVDWLREPNTRSLTIYGAGFEAGEVITVLISYPDGSLGMIGGGDVVTADSVGVWSLTETFGGKREAKLNLLGIHSVTVRGSEGGAASAAFVVAEK